MPRMPTPARRSLASDGLLILVVSLAVIALQWLTWPYVEDDAYIHCQFARNLVDRGEFSFNPGEKLLGDTAPAWVGVLATGGLLGIAYPTATKVLSGAFAVVAVWLFVVAARRLPRPAGVPALSQGWTAALFLVHPFFVAVIPTGMETTGVLAFLVGFGIAVHRVLSTEARLPTWKAALFGVLTGSGILLRPEYFLLGPCGALALSWRARTTETQRERLIATGSFLLGWAGVIAAVALALSSYFGYLLPTTMSAKAYSQGLLSLGAAARTLRVLAFGFGAPLGIVSLVFVLRWANPLSVLRRVPFPLHAWVLALLGGYMLISTNLQSRYGLLFWPWVALVLTAALDSLASVWQRRLLQAVSLFALGIPLGIMVIPALVNRVHNARSYREFTDCVIRSTPQDAVVSAYAIGEMGFRTGRRLVDVGAIATPEMARIAPPDRHDLAVRKGATHAVVEVNPLAEPGPLLSGVVCLARLRNATWQFPPGKYREGWFEALVPVSALALPTQTASPRPPPT